MKDDDAAADAEIYKRSKDLDRMNKIYRKVVAAVLKEPLSRVIWLLPSPGEPLRIHLYGPLLV